jgi:hypothetical protein
VSSGQPCVAIGSLPQLSNRNRARAHIANAGADITEIEWPGSDVYLITVGGTGQVVAAS